MTKFILLTLIILIAGCTSVKETYTPTGKQGFTIKCSGKLNSWASCMEKAGDTCGELGYTIIERNGETGQHISASNGIISGGSTRSRTMLISCKK